MASFRIAGILLLAGFLCAERSVLGAVDVPTAERDAENRVNQVLTDQKVQMIQADKDYKAAQLKHNQMADQLLAIRRTPLPPSTDPHSIPAEPAAPAVVEAPLTQDAPWLRWVWLGGGVAAFVLLSVIALLLRRESAKYSELKEMRDLQSKRIEARQASKGYNKIPKTE
ncbi:MAG: hypothetical protein M5U26_22785 [Planctomycetota bacterium]|nr:hypothetical protein [Planctomycetota bacterium]